MPGLIDLTGKKFGRLTVIERAPNRIYASGTPHTTWECVCECGKHVVVRGDALRGGTTLSCGCLQREVASTYGKINGGTIRYGDSRERIHNIWYLMKYRCEDKTSPAYINYGGRGIKVCQEWDDGDDGYFAFKEWALCNGYKEDLTLDRIDNNGNYEPVNCRWTSLNVQANNKRNNVYYDYDGQMLTLPQISEKCGIPWKVLWERIHRNWGIDRAATQPVRKSPTHKPKTANNT